MGGHDCPACGRSFDTRRGLSVHHSQVHGERLPNRTCDHCGEAFYSEYVKKYCSRECLLESDAYVGENNPNYRGGMETAECRLCDMEFEYYPSEKAGIYCADCVNSEDWQRPPVITGSDHPQWSGGKVELECSVCDRPVLRYPSGVTSEVVLCSQDCRSKWLSDRFSGEGHPNWKGGGNEPYGTGWRRAKLTTLERDGRTCVLCGTTDEELGRNPDVHHIVPVRAFENAPAAERADAHVPRNLVTLCVGCHRRADFGQPAKAKLKRLIES